MGQKRDMILTRTIAPAALLELADVKLHARVDHDDDDALIASLMQAAMSSLDGPNGIMAKALVTQTWSMQTWPVAGKDRLHLPLTPFVQVTSITYLDAAEAEQTADPADFTIRGEEDWAYIEPKTTWPAMAQRADALTVVWQAGYGAPAAVPAEIVLAAKMLVAHWYFHREAVSTQMHEMPWAVRELLSLRRKGWVAA